MEEVQHRLRHVRPDEDAAQDHAQDDRRDGEAFDPTVRDDEFAGRQEFGEDPVLRGGVRGGADAHDRVGQKRVATEEHQKAPAALEKVRDEHHAALRHAVREDPDPGGEADVAHDEEELQERRHPVGRLEARQKRDRGDEQGVVR